MTQWLKVLASKLDNQSLTPEICFPLDLCTHVSVCTCTHKVLIKTHLFIFGFLRYGFSV